MGSVLPMAAEQVGLSLGGREVLREVGFRLPAGGITALLGANGAGKSVLLRLCQGLLAPSRGRIAWADEPAGRRALVFQRPVLLRRSVAGNIAHALAAAGQPRAARAERTAAALARFGLAALARRPARLLSGGEQQRVAVARAWALAPELLLLDEPTAHLDPSATHRIEAHLRAMADEGITILLATHDLGQVRRLAGRVLFLHEGRLLEDRPAAGFLAAPHSAPARAHLAGRLAWNEGEEAP